MIKKKKKKTKKTVNGNYSKVYMEKICNENKNNKK